MVKVGHIFLLLASFLFVSPVLAGQFTITKVYDGDTVRAETADTAIYIFLLGIDAPEISDNAGEEGQPFGKSAKEELAQLVLNKTVEVKGYGKAGYPDNYIVGVIYAQGKNINLELVRRGVAEVHKEGLPEGFDVEPYLAAETEARENKTGMWILGDKYVSPSQWRKSRMEQ